MKGKNNIIEKLKKKYPQKIFTYDNVFFNYKCDVLNEEELKSINEANKEIKESIISYIKTTQEEINEYIKENKDGDCFICYKNINDLSNTNLSKLYFENNIHLFPELTLNVYTYSK